MYNVYTILKNNHDHPHYILFSISINKMNSEFFNQKLVAHIQMLWKQLSLLTFSGYRFSVLSRPCSKIQHATGEKM